jgi:Xaa-Pro aminopeptidase
MSISTRIQKIRRKMVERGLDALLVSQPENRHYLSGFGGECYLLITAQGTVLMTDFRYTEQAEREAPECSIFKIASDLSTWFPSVVSKLAPATLGFEVANVTVQQHTRFTDALAGANLKIKLVPVEGMIESLRAIKEPEEIDLITKASLITDRACEYVINNLHAGMSERDAAWIIERYMRENDSDGVAFEVIVAGGVNAAMAHHRPSNDLLLPGAPIVMDFGARYLGYCSDLTRTITLGAHTAEFDKRYQIVLKAQLEALDKIKSGMTGEQADAIAREYIARDGFGEAFGHGLGHGVGLFIHESPRVGPRSTDVLQDGMVFSVEPGIYLTGWGGVRIEDTVVMENGRVRKLTQSPKVLQY